jgi:anti-sigma factor RsiW
MTQLTPISETDLHAFADGKLAPERSAEVETWLAERPDKAAEVASWQRQNEALHALFDGAAGETVPSRLDPHVISRSPAALSRPHWPRYAAAAMLLLALGGTLGWAGNAYFARQGEREDLIAAAVSAHALFVKENRHAVEVAADDGEHLTSWLSNRIERPITPPDLSADGFALVGGRLLPGYDGGGPAAQLMYENAAKERVTVYVTAALADRRTEREFTSRDNLDAFYWANDRITCTVVGDLPQAQMQDVARKIYTQMSWRPDAATGT